MRSFWTGQLTTPPVTGYASVASVVNGITSGGSETVFQIPLTETVVVTKMRYWLGTAPGASGSGRYRSVTLRANASDTAATVTINETAIYAEWSGSVPITAGDLISIRLAASGTVAATTAANWNIEYTLAGNKFVILGMATLGANTTQKYMNPQSSTLNPQTTGDSYKGIIPINSTISKLSARTGTAAGSSMTDTLTLMKNGSTIPATATVMANTTNTSTSTFSANFAAGDSIAITNVQAGGTPAARNVGWSVTVETSTFGSMFTLFSSGSTSTAVTNQYVPIWGFFGIQGSATTTGTFLMPELEASNLYISVNITPGTARLFTLQDPNAVDTALTVTITNPATAGSNTANKATIGSDSVRSKMVRTQNTVSGGTASIVSGGLVLRLPNQPGTKIWDGSAWVDKPLKIWNGTDWVQKGIKVWNGSAWVPKN